MDNKLNRDGNLLGRLCALAIIAVALAGVGRASGYCAGLCPFAAAGHCLFSR